MMVVVQEATEPRATDDRGICSVVIYGASLALDELAANVLFRRRLTSRASAVSIKKAAIPPRGEREPTTHPQPLELAVFSAVDPPVALGPVTPPAPAPPSFDVPR